MTPKPPPSEGANSYDSFVLRNRGYIPDDLQKKIHNTRVLLAGCGLGSPIAEALLRTGFTRLLLVDHDTIAPHNLNRQNFTAADIGRRKVEALADRLRAIFPAAEIETMADRVRLENARAIVERVDLILDTIDFLSLPDLVSLHDAARESGKPLLSCLTAGWGAAALYFPPGNPCTARRLFGLPDRGPVTGASYVERFAGIMKALAGRLNPAITAVMAEALTVMEDGTPCPASQVAAGGAAVAALAATLAVRVVGGQPVAVAPRIHLVDLDRLAPEGTLTLGGPA